MIDLNFTDERILATLSPANLKTKEDGSIFQKNGPRLRLYLDAFLLQANQTPNCHSTAPSGTRSSLPSGSASGHRACRYLRY